MQSNNSLYKSVQHIFGYNTTETPEIFRSKKNEATETEVEKKQEKLQICCVSSTLNSVDCK